MAFEYKTKPFEHQAELFKKTKDTRDFGYFWEQGCGKTKPNIDTIAWNFDKNEIDAAIIIAPNGVHRNWVTDEMPAHMPIDYHAEFWQSGKHNQTKFKNDMRALLEAKGLAVLAMSYDSLLTPAGKEFAGKFMRRRRCFMGLDESQAIKSWDAMRTRTCDAAGKFAHMRRILSGTPIAQGPFDIYTQIRFLNPEFWKSHGISAFTGFKQEFGEWEQRQIYRGGKQHKFLDLKQYKNLDKLEELIKLISHRLTKEEAKLNLPPKIYSKRYVEMTPAQEKAYRELKEQMFTILNNGELVEAPLAITQLLRFQQVVCGYVTDIEGNVINIIDEGKNPRIKALQEEVEGCQGKQGIIWARFTPDIDQICTALQKMGKSVVRYDGKVSEDDRAKGKKLFQDGGAEWFVGNQAAGATGLTLTQAKRVMYYSNSFRLIDRLQSEDRAHRIGQDEPVLYTDFIAPGTVDEHTVKALREKRDVASSVLGDNITEWI